jgi:hypothetical protein
MVSMRRSATRALGGLLFSCALFAACSSPETSGAVGTSGSMSAGIGIETSSLFITIENRAGTPLSDVNISLEGGGATTYTAHFPKMATGEKKDIPTASLKGRDGSTLNLLAVHPRQITVTGVDLMGKKHNVTVPWKP